MADTAPVYFQCPHCAKRFTWKTELAGKRVRCKCGQPITVPFTADAPVAKPTTQATSPLQRPSPPPVRPRPMPVVAAIEPEPIGYAGPGVQPRRAGILIAIGVISIVVGCISALASGVTAMLWLDFYTKSVQPAPIFPPPLPAPAFGPYTGATLPADGFAAPVRQQIISALPITGPVAAQRREMLDRLLAEVGAKILPGQSADALTPTPVPGHNVSAPDAPDEPICFKSPTGIVWVHQEYARYEPDDRYNQPIIFVDRDIVQHGGPSHLNAIAVDLCIARLRSRAAGINNMQTAFAAHQLSADDNYVAQVKDPNLNNPQNAIGPASLDDNHVLTVSLNKKDYVVLPDGRGILQSIIPDGIDPVTGISRTPLPSNFRPLMPGDPNQMDRLHLFCLGSVALAGYLILCGVGTLVRPGLVVPLHRVYIGLKFIAIATEALLSNAYFASIPGIPNSIRPFDVSVGWQGVFTTTIMQAIYPVALVVLFATHPKLRRVKGSAAQ